MLDVLFLSVLNMSITASLVILVVLLVRLFLKKAPKIFSYALWAVVLFRLICPFSFDSALGLLPINATPIPQDIVYSTAPQIDTGLSIVDDAINPILPIPNNRENSINPLQIWVFLGSAIWAIGILAMLIYSIIQLVRLKRKLIGSTPLKDNIHLADHISSPFVMGLLNPKIYLPSSMTKSEQEFIIAHEQHHIKRFDHIVRILSFIALTIHWFNPLAWFSFILSGKDMEMSCDEAVMKKRDTDIRAEYSQSLLHFSTGRKFIAATPLAFGEGDTKDRVKNVMKYKKPMLWVSIIAIIAVICVVVGLMSNSKKELFSNFDYSQIDKIQVTSSMGNPHYGADSKIITDKNEIRQFIDTFNSGSIGSKVKDEELQVGFPSLYTLYQDEIVVAEYSFNSNDTNVIWWNDDYRNIVYDVKLKTPFDLYQQSRSFQIIVDQDGKEMDLIRYNGETYVKSKLSQETITWLENYNTMSPEEQNFISFSPDLGETFNPGLK